MKNIIRTHVYQILYTLLFALLGFTLTLIFKFNRLAIVGGLQLNFAFLLFLFYICDIYGLDGALVYTLAKIFGSKANFENHLFFITFWKAPLLILMLLSLIISNYTLLVFLNIVELLLFYITFVEIHKLGKIRSILLVAIIAISIIVSINFLF